MFHLLKLVFLFALFIWMGVDSWNPLIYHIEKVYHTPQDNVLENISPERMRMALDVIGTGVYNSLQKPVPQTEQKVANHLKDH